MSTAFEYPYIGYGNRPAKCGLEVFRFSKFSLVIATELEDNPGTSITNMAEHLATQVCKDLGLPASSLVWVEQYPACGPSYDRNVVEEHWDLTRFQVDVGSANFQHPAWFRLSEEQLGLLKVGVMPEDLPPKVRHDPDSGDSRPQASQ